MAIPKAEREYQLAHIHESRQAEMAAADISCLVLSWIALILRLVSLRLDKRRFRMDDYCITAATVISSGWFIGGILQDFKTGFGQHDLSLTPDQFIMAQKIGYISAVVYYASYPLIKITILLLYHQIFGTAYPWFRKVNFVVLALNIMTMISMFLVSVLQCVPPSGYWDRSVDATCVDGNAFNWGQAVINTIMDFIILLMPLPIIWNMQTTRRRKIHIWLLFGLGSATCIVSLLRIILYKNMNPYDINYTFVPPTIATNVEICLGIWCANIPALRSVFNTVFHSKIMSSFFREMKPASRNNGKDHLDDEFRGCEKMEMGQKRQAFGDSILSAPDTCYLRSKDTERTSAMEVNTSSSSKSKSDYMIRAKSPWRDEEKAA